MSRIETLREQIKIVKSMSQSSHHWPIVIAGGDVPIFVRNNDGAYARNERGHLMLDQMAMYKQPVAVNHSLGDLLRNDQRFTDYLECLANLTVSETPFRKLQLRPRKSSPYEMAKWGGVLWGGRTDSAATEYALRQEIQKTMPKARPYLVKLPYRGVSGKSISVGRLCKEIMWADGKYWWLTPEERKLQDIIDDRVHVDPVRLSTTLTSAYAQLPIDSRFAVPVQTLEKFYVPEQRGVYHSTGHWDKRKY